MRVFLYGSGSYATSILQALADSGQEVIGVCSTMPSNWWRSRLRRLRRGLGDHGLWPLPCIIYRDPSASWPHPAEVARQQGLPVWPSRQVNSPDFHAALADLSPDLILVAGFPRLIPTAGFAVARVASVNFHPSLLPRHRGGTPNRWIVLNGERETGITVHHLSAKFDTGPVVLQRRLTVTAEQTWGDVEENLARCMKSACGDLLQLVERGPLPKQPQDETNASYEPSLSGALVTVDWNCSAERIRRLTLALRPKTGAMTRIGGRPLCLWEVDVLTRASASARPAEVIGLDRGDLVVATGEGALAVRRVLWNGGVRRGKLLLRLGMKPGTSFDPPSPSTPAQIAPAG